MGTIMKINDVTKVKIMVDMDGVIVDFAASVVANVDPDFVDNPATDHDPEWKKDFWGKVKTASEEGKDLWYDAPAMQDAQVLWNFVKGYKHEILSATGRSEYGAFRQKMRWMDEFDSSVKVNLVRKSPDKAAFASPNTILIDDRPKAINPWIAAGGIGVLHTSAADTIRQLKALGL